MISSRVFTSVKALLLLLGSALLAVSQTIQFAPQSYSESSYLMDAEGMLLVWGWNGSGQLGMGNSADATTPKRLPLPSGVTNWMAAAGGTTTTFAIDQSGRLFSCGGVPFRNLGHPSVQSNLLFVAFPAGVGRWTEVAAGNDTLLIADTGTAYAIGDSPLLANAPLPYAGECVQVLIPTSARHVVAGRTHFAVLGADGNMYLWGYNDAGQIGQGYSSGMSVTNPTLLAFPSGVTNWSSAAAGGFHTLAVGSDANLYAWGANNYGQLGISSNVAKLATPIQVPLPAGASAWKQLAAGEYHSVALADNGRIYGCGVNTSGILGTGSTTNEYKFTEVIRPAGVTNWITLSAGRYHTLALGDNGMVYSWGYAMYGALGNGSLVSFQAQPKPVLYRIGVSATNSPDLVLGADLPSGSNWVIEASSDLISWYAVSTNFVHGAQLQTSRLCTSSNEFFRLTRFH